MKRILKWLWAALILMVCAMPVQAQNVPEVTSYINDYAGIVDAATEQELNRLGRQLENETGAQIVVVTVDSLDGQDAAMLATKIGNQAGVGSSSDNGVVILVSMQDKQRFMAIGSGLEGDITDIESRHLQEQYLVPAFQRGNYAQGIADLYKATANEIGALPTTGTNQKPASSDTGSGILLVLCGGVLVLMLIFFVFAAGSKKNMRKEIRLGVGQSWPMKVSGFDFSSGTVFVSSSHPDIVEVRPGGVLYGVRPGMSTVTVQKSGETFRRFDVTVTRNYGSGRRDDDLLNALFWGSMMGRGRRYGGGYGYRPPRSGGFGGFGGGGFTGGGGGFRGGGSGGSW